MTQPAEDEHLDHALSEEFAGHGAKIHELKLSDAHFRGLLERNHTLWKEIQQVQKGLQPSSDEHLATLEKQRLAILDEIAVALESTD